MRSQRQGRGGIFDTTLQGQKPEDSAEDPRQKKCLCGDPHRFSQCPHIIPSIRPDGWKPNPEVEKRIQRIIAKNANVRRGVEAARKHVQAQSASSASAATPPPPPALPALPAPPAPPASLPSAMRTPSAKSAKTPVEKQTRLIGAIRRVPEAAFSNTVYCDGTN